MKRVFAVIFTAIFVLGVFSGCGKKEEKAPSPTGPAKEEIHFGADLTVAQFKKNITALMDVGEAVCSETNNIIAYTLKGEPEYKVDGKVVFTDGTITLPDGHISIVKNGFTSEYYAHDPVYNEMQGQSILYNTTDGTVGMKFYLDEEADDYGTISGVRYTTIVMDKRGGNIPRFELTGGVTRDSQVEDIIKAYGMPKTLGYDELEKRIHMDYKTSDGNYMLFQFSPEGEKMTLSWFEMKYEE